MRHKFNNCIVKNSTYIQEKYLKKQFVTRPPTISSSKHFFLKNVLLKNILIETKIIYGLILL